MAPYTRQVIHNKVPIFFILLRTKHELQYPENSLI